MYPPSQAVEECLDIAVDHRLRALFKPVCKTARLDIGGNHGLCLDEITSVNTQRTIHEPEVRITCRFFNYGWSGGITVILLQPSNFHPYWKGFRSVIEDCPTYCFLDEGFKAVTCGTSRLGDGSLSIVDSAPYIRPRDNAPVECKREMRRRASRIIREKRRMLSFACGKTKRVYHQEWRRCKAWALVEILPAQTYASMESL
jgi:hypothetical protein